MEKVRRNFKGIILIFFVVTNVFIYYAIYKSHAGILKVAFLDVGQGDSILVESPVGNQILIDGGSNGKVLESLGQALPFYDRSIDAVIATHPDKDHIGGVPEILKNYKVNEYFDNGAVAETATDRELKNKVEKLGIKYELARSGEVLDIGGGAYLVIISPSGEPRGSDTNKYSVVAKLIFGEISFLLTGDAPTEVKNKLAIAYGEGLKSQVLKVAHHGSRNSLSEAFLSAVSPDYSIISAGKDNSYGHPHIEVLDFLQKINSKVIETFQYGNIVFESNGAKMKRD
ncbi:MAG: ComEC/Rec2 family competence protein [Candidatus Paceibacterota bacterium]|jgi:competence protein ComEC